MNLTVREQQVLNGLCEGWTNREIATDLTIGIETVRTYLKQVYEKLGVASREQAIVHVYRQRLRDMRALYEGDVA